MTAETLGEGFAYFCWARHRWPYCATFHPWAILYFWRESMR